MPQKSLLRDNLEGLSDNNDRLWSISGKVGKNEFTCGLTEYNDEITGFAPLLRSLFKGYVFYSARASFVLNEARKRGYKVEEVPDRNRNRVRLSGD